MKKAMLLRKELLEQASLSEQELLEWEKLKLVKPDGMTKNKVRFYSRDTLDLLLHVRDLKRLGYEPEHILKIIKNYRNAPYFYEFNRSKGEINLAIFFNE